MDRETILVSFAAPVYIAAIGLELIISHWRKTKLYTFKETATNVYLMVLNITFDLLCRGIAFAAMYFCYQWAPVQFSTSTVLYWFSLIILVDIMYYWLHRLDHYSRFFWAVHVTHHSSTHYNISAGFRSSVFEPLYRFVFYIPLAFIGFNPLDVFFIHSLLQTIGVLVHTQHIGKLPTWIEYIFVTPSHHRVHHGSNVQYLDKNMGMTLIIWDRLFGTFAEEDPLEPIEYGLTKNPEDRGAVNIVFHEWRHLWKDLSKSKSLSVKWKYIFKPPGWSHDGSSLTADQMRALKYKQQASEPDEISYSSVGEIQHP